MTFQRTIVPKFRSKVEACPSLPNPLPPLRKVGLWHIAFALRAMNGPLPAELKIRENTARVQESYPLTKTRKYRL